MAQKPKLLYLVSRVPYPLDKGDKLRAYHQIKGLSADFDLILVCLNAGRSPKQKDLSQLSTICNEVYVIQLSFLGIVIRLIKGLFSPLPFQVHYFYSKKAQNEFDKIIEKHTPKRIFCQLIRTTEYALKYTIFDKTLDYMDALSIGMKRRLETAPFYLKPLVSMEYTRLRKYENKMFAAFEKKVIISEQDKEYIAHQNTEEISVIANGIDLEYWKPLEAERKFDISFTGNMAYPPNVEGAQYIVKKILPLLKTNHSSTRVLIAGKSPVPAVKSLKAEAVEVSGWIEDIRKAYASSKVFVAPMNLGSGLQNKLLEALAMGIPAVTSPLANKALGAKDNEEILVASTPEEFAEKVELLLNDASLYDRLSQGGRRLVESHYDWKSWNEKLKELILK